MSYKNHQLNYQFIAERRKLKNLTQFELAEKLDITDRAVSAWERGISLPDSGIMLELCNILEISVNELLSGEVVKMEDYEKRVNENLLSMTEENEGLTKMLIRLEWGIRIAGVVIYALLSTAMLETNNDVLTLVFLIFNIITIIGVLLLTTKIRQKTGYYECQNCHHKYKPTYKSLLNTGGFGNKIYIKCPYCNEKHQHKRVLRKV